MKNILILLAGGMMGYGVFLVMKKKYGTPAAPARPPGFEAKTAPTPAPAAAAPTTMTETTEYLPAYAGMLGHYDARPEVLFAPPKAYVAVPGAGVTDLITNVPGGAITLE